MESRQTKLSAFFETKQGPRPNPPKSTPINPIDLEEENQQKPKEPSLKRPGIEVFSSPERKSYKKDNEKRINATKENMRPIKFIGNQLRMPFSFKRWPKYKNLVSHLASANYNDRVAFLQVFWEIVSVSFNGKSEKHNIGVLGRYIRTLNQGDLTRLLFTTMPFIGRLVLRTEELFKDQPVALLLQQETKEIKFNKLQVGCLLANMFLCTFPFHSMSGDKYPSPQNFSVVFDDRLLVDVKKEKLACILNYFDRLSEYPSPEKLFCSFARVVVPSEDASFWLSSSMKMTRVDIIPKKRLEDAEGAVQVDFANKYIGGGVLSSGCVQEEIRFLICPELIPSILFSECLERNESLYFVGQERFSNYQGYRDSFKFDGDFIDVLPIDETQRPIVHLTAIDAIKYEEKTKSTQFESKEVLREINKAFCGFKGVEPLKQNASANRDVASGKWGCGAFGGDPLIKFLIQWIACSQSKRNLQFYTFDSEEKEIEKTKKAIQENPQVTVGLLVSLLLEFNPKSGESLCDFLMNSLNKFL